MLKKTLLILTVFFTICFSTVSFASCNLDMNRWRWVTSTDKFGVYVDTQTLKYSNNFAQVWQCLYCPNGCELYPNIGEHYHYNLEYINYGNNTMGMRSFSDMDSRGHVLESKTYSYVNYSPIPPGTVAESMAIFVRNLFTRRY